MARLSLAVLLSVLVSAAHAQHLGFDKNDYPGDDALPTLRETFEWTGYWLANPPGAKSNSWMGKRPALHKAGFGFALLFPSPTNAQLADQSHQAIQARARADAAAAVNAAKNEGFREHSVIFLDIEEGGRLTPQQLQYVSEFLSRVESLHMRPGVYCSGIAVSDGPGKTITTAQQIRTLHIPNLKFWIANDSCPPSPGCVADRKLSTDLSGDSHADIWQYAQSPRRAQFAASCARTYVADDRCYAPTTQVFIDMNTSRTADPSAPR